MAVSPGCRDASGPGPAPRPHSEVAEGGLFSALAAIAVASMAAIVKWGSHGFSTEFLVAIRFGAGLLAFVIIGLIRRQAFLYRASHPLRCSLVAASWVGGIFCCYFAIRFIPLTDAVLLVYTAPIFAPLLNWVFLRKTEPPSVWLGIGLGFVGVVFVLRPGTETLQVHALIGLMSGLLFAIRLVINASLTKTESKEVITFYSLGVGWLICLGVLALTGLHVANWEHNLFPPQYWLRPWIVFPGVLLAVAALGVLCMLQAWFTAAAYEHASVGEAGPFRYVGVVFAALLDWLGWGQVPDLYSVLGFVFITVGGIWVITHEGKKKAPG
jgi:drug/metabolite transporter (DMT)-like permease